MHEQLGNADQLLPHVLLLRYLVCPCLECPAQAVKQVGKT